MKLTESCGGQGHHQAVVLPDRSTVLACSFPPDGYHRDPVPDFGLYLDQRWHPPWPNAHIRWPDFGLPSDPVMLDAGVDDLLSRAHRGEVVAIGCLGGHGRTGTALAMAAIKAGLTEDAVRWTRSVYCHLAIETKEQEAFVRSQQSHSKR